MKPTLEPGEFVLVSKVAYKIGEPRHGDVVVFHYPRDPSEDYVKRIIGLPGDEIVVNSGEVYVNNVLLDESYLAAPTGYNNSWTVPENSLFVLGDNRNQSSDSHVWGFVPIDQVVGKALAIYWPINRFKILDTPDLVQASSAP
jgi:signal peptidase I